MLLLGAIEELVDLKSLDEPQTKDRTKSELLCTPQSISSSLQRARPCECKALRLRFDEDGFGTARLIEHVLARDAF